MVSKSVLFLQWSNGVNRRSLSHRLLPQPGVSALELRCLPTHRAPGCMRLGSTLRDLYTCIRDFGTRRGSDRTAYKADRTMPGEHSLYLAYQCGRHSNGLFTTYSVSSQECIHVPDEWAFNAEI